MLFALLMPMLLLFAVVVLDVGNMYVHKRHSQTLVDAGAFAGATKFVGCSFQFGDPVAANEAIAATALEYAGDTYRSARHTATSRCKSPTTFVSSSTAIASGPTDDPLNGDGLDYTLDHDSNPMTAGDPCSSTNARRQGDGRRRPAGSSASSRSASTRRARRASRSSRSRSSRGCCPGRCPRSSRPPSPRSSSTRTPVTSSRRLSSSATSRHVSACPRPTTSSPTGARLWATTRSTSRARTRVSSSSSRRWTTHPLSAPGPAR